MGTNTVEGNLEHVWFHGLRTTLGLEGHLEQVLYFVLALDADVNSILFLVLGHLQLLVNVGLVFSQDIFISCSILRTNDILDTLQLFGNNTCYPVLFLFIGLYAYLWEYNPYRVHLYTYH